MKLNLEVSRRAFCSRLLSLGALNLSRPFFSGHGFSRPQLGSRWGESGVGQEPQITFRNVATEAGITPKLVCGTPEKRYIIEVNGTGCVWFDYNNDGYVDLYIVNGSTIEQLSKSSSTATPPRNYLFRNNGDRTFTDVTRTAHVEGHGWGCGAVAADYNNDGNVDLFVYTYGKNILYRNNGDGTFTDVTEHAGVGGESSWSGGAAFADYDNDGFLDLYVSGYIDFDLHRLADYDRMTCQFKGIKVAACGPRGYRGAPDVLYHNNGDGTFTDVTARAGVSDTKLYYGFSVAFEDFDGDGRPDILVANDSNPNCFYRNKGDGTFEEVGVTAGIAYNGEGLEQSNMGLALGDIDNDGWTDVFITEFAEDNFTLFHNDGKGIFSDISYPSGVAEATLPNLGWATFFMDYNNDGLKDLFCVNGHVYPEADRAKNSTYRQPPLLLANLGNRRFKPVNSQVGLAGLRLPGRGGAFCDYDNDGDLDVAIINIDDRPTLLRNDGGNQAGRWLQVKTVGAKSNRDGIGAAVKVLSGDLTQYDRVRTGGSFCSSNDTRLHFGLGMRDVVDLVEIQWPSGTVDRLTRLDPNQVLVVREGQGRIPSPYRPLRAPHAGRVGGSPKR
jgi:hypothetical protein